MGDTIANLLWRIEDGEIDNYTPKAVVVSIGESDFGLSANEVVAGYESIYQSIKRHQPNAKIFFLVCFRNQIVTINHTFSKCCHAEDCRINDGILLER